MIQTLQLHSLELRLRIRHRLQHTAPRRPARDQANFSVNVLSPQCVMFMARLLLAVLASNATKIPKIK
jgi:hypothetical protein